jgi:uncharacterized protein (DUF3820 family)
VGNMHVKQLNTVIRLQYLAWFNKVQVYTKGKLGPIYCNFTEENC